MTIETIPASAVRECGEEPTPPEECAAYQVALSEGGGA